MNISIVAFPRCCTLRGSTSTHYIRFYKIYNMYNKLKKINFSDLQKYVKLVYLFLFKLSMKILQFLNKLILNFTESVIMLSRLGYIRLQLIFRWIFSLKWGWYDNFSKYLQKTAKFIKLMLSNYPFHCKYFFSG